MVHDVCLFLNMKVQSDVWERLASPSLALEWAGNTALAPFRYIFNGKTILVITRDSDKQIEIHHVASFHKNGYYHHSKTALLTSYDERCRSSQTHMIKAALSVVLIIPGFFIGVICKGIAHYFSSEVQRRYSLAKEHFTPMNVEIGTASAPIVSRNELEAKMEKAHKANSKNRPTNAVIIYGDGNLTIAEDPGVLKFNPMKLIFVGARMVHEPSVGQGCLDERLDPAKWKGVDTVRKVTGSADADKSFANATDVDGVKQALETKAPRRSWTSCKRYRQVFTLPRQNIIHHIE